MMASYILFARKIDAQSLSVDDFGDDFEMQTDACSERVKEMDM